MNVIGSRAVVLGASMGGLLAARVLSEAYEQVTVLDRDDLTANDSNPRRGVPQGRHGHGLHPRGLQALDELFAGFSSEAVAAGAPMLHSSQIRAVLGGHELCRAETGAPYLSTSRPFLEHHVRRRLSALPNVSLVGGRTVVGPVAAGSGDRLTGVRVRSGDEGPERTVDADVVVDATGRAGHALRWLDGMGFDPPPQDELRVGVTYATRRLRLSDAAMGNDRVVVIGPQPGRLTGMYLAQQEHGWWILTIFGYEGSEPPRDPDGFHAFVARVAPADLVPVLATAEPLSEVFTHRLPSNLRRRYDRVRRFPAGFLVFGDAVCSFNPIYGQGMTVAALQAMTLRRQVQSGRIDARRFFRAAARPVGDAWDLATGADLSLPEVQGPRPRKVRLLNAYVDRLQRVATRDATVSRAFQRVVGMLDRPTALLHPALVARVAWGRAPGSAPASEPIHPPLIAPTTRELTAPQ